MIFYWFQETQLVSAKVRQLLKDPTTSHKEESQALIKWSKQITTDAAEYVTRSFKFADINAEVNLFRLYKIVMNHPLNEKALRRLAEFLEMHGKYISQLVFDISIDFPGSSSALKAFLRSLASLKSLRKVHFGRIPFSDSFFAALYVTSIQVVEIGHMHSPVQLNASEYKALCLFLESHPNLTTLRLHVRRREDPGLSAAFQALSRNRNSALRVSLIYSYFTS